MAHICNVYSFMYLGKKKKKTPRIDDTRRPQTYVLNGGLIKSIRRVCFFLYICLIDSLGVLSRHTVTMSDGL